MFVTNCVSDEHARETAVRMMRPEFASFENLARPDLRAEGALANDFNLPLVGRSKSRSAAKRFRAGARCEAQPPPEKSFGFFDLPTRGRFGSLIPARSARTPRRSRRPCRQPCPKAPSARCGAACRCPDRRFPPARPARRRGKRQPLPVRQLEDDVAALGRRHPHFGMDVKADRERQGLTAGLLRRQAPIRTGQCRPPRTERDLPLMTHAERRGIAVMACFHHPAGRRFRCAGSQPSPARRGVSGPEACATSRPSGSLRCSYRRASESNGRRSRATHCPMSRGAHLPPRRN